MDRVTDKNYLFENKSKKSFIHVIIYLFIICLSLCLKSIYTWLYYDNSYFHIFYFQKQNKIKHKE